MFDRQEAFNAVWRHFVTKGRAKSIGKDGECCMYRGPRGQKCAIGVLIADDDYDPEWDRDDPPSAGGPTIRRVLGAPESDMEFLEDLQYVHDYAGYPFHDNIRRRLKGLAAEYNLTIPGRRR